MGNSPTKPDPELENAKAERDAKKATYEEELETMKTNHQQQEQRMNEELASRNSDLDNLRKNMVESNRKNDEELRELRVRQSQRAKELEVERAAELANLRGDAEQEKRRVYEQFEKRAAELKKEHDEVIRKTLEEKAEEKRKAEAAIRKAESERDEVERQKSEDVRKHQEALDKMSKDHRKEVNENYEKLEEQMEKQTLAAINRIALETKQKLAIVGANQRNVEDDTIVTIYRNVEKEYMAIGKRLAIITGHLRDITATIDEVRADPECEFPYELSDVHNNFLTDSTLLNKQMTDLRNRLTLSLEVSKEFKEQLQAPLAPYEDSMRNVKATELRIQRAINKENVKALPPMYDTFHSHLEVLEGISKNMDAIQYEDVVKKALASAAQKSIQN